MGLANLNRIAALVVCALLSALMPAEAAQEGQFGNESVSLSVYLSGDSTMTAASSVVFVGTKLGLTATVSGLDSGESVHVDIYDNDLTVGSGDSSPFTVADYTSVVGVRSFTAYATVSRSSDGESVTVHTASPITIKVFEVTGIKVADGSRIAKDGLLEVVGPASLPLLTPKASITGTATLNPDVTPPAGGEHPKWSISPQGIERTGVKSIAEDVEGSALPAPTVLLLSGITPTSQTVTCEGKSATVKVYPSESRKVVRVLEELPIVIIMNNINSALNFIPLGPGKLKWEEPVGKFELKNQWKKQSDTNLCGWTFDATLKAEPLVGGTFEIVWGLGSLCPASIRDYVADASLYIAIGGKLSAEGGASRNEYAQLSASGGLTGTVGGEIGLKGQLADGMVALKLAGNTEFKGSGKLVVDAKDISLDGKVDWNGIGGILELKALWGWVTLNESVTFVEPKSIWKDTVAVYTF